MAKKKNNGMELLNVWVPPGIKLCAFGDVHGHEEQVDKLFDWFNKQENMWLISVGDLIDRGFGEECDERITNKMKDLVDAGKGFVVRGNHEIKCKRRAKESGKPIKDYIMWLSDLPLSLTFVFKNGTRVVALHGGVRPDHTHNDLIDDIEICYIRNIDKNGKHVPLCSKKVDGKKFYYPADPDSKLWHEIYDGRFGYIISGHQAQRDGIPKFYNYSCNLDTACYNTGKLTAMVYGENGREEILTFTGKMRYEIPLGPDEFVE